MTLGEYRRLAAFISRSEDSKLVKFFDAKIAEQGEDQEVLADESQMMFLIEALLGEELKHHGK